MAKKEKKKLAKAKTEFIGLRASALVRDALREEAERRDIPVSQLIREIIVRWFGERRG